MDGQRAFALANELFSLVVVVGVFRGFLEFVGGLVEQLLGLFGVAAQLVFVGFLRFVNFFDGLPDVVLSLGQIGMLGRVNISFRALRKGYADESQTNRKSDRQIETFLFHDSSSPCR